MFFVFTITDDNIIPIRKLYPTCRSVAPAEAPENKLKRCQRANVAEVATIAKILPFADVLKKSSNMFWKSPLNRNSSYMPISRQSAMKSHSRSALSMVADSDMRAE